MKRVIQVEKCEIGHSARPSSQMGQERAPIACIIATEGKKYHCVPAQLYSKGQLLCLRVKLKSNTRAETLWEVMENEEKI